MENETTIKLAAASRNVRAPARAFTLIELLVVIAVIATLAALIIPITGAVKRAQIKHRARSELSEVASWIQSYKEKLGYYPPDNPPDPGPGTLLPLINQLYYELLGTTVTGNAGTLSYRTLDGSAQITTAELNNYFGSKVGGFMNSTKGGDEGTPAQKIVPGLKATQFLTLVGTNLTVLGSAVEGPPDVMLQGPNGRKINPWRYVSSNPTNNPRTFDLWIDVLIGSKTNRISNWSD